MLARVRDQLVDRKCFSIEIARGSSEVKTYSVSPHARIVLGLFLSEQARETYDESFWMAYCPKRPGERWPEPLGKLPPHLGLCFAFSDEGNLADFEFAGKSFDFAQIDGAPTKR